MITLNWTNTLFSSNYKIFDGEIQLGELSHSSFSNNNIGTLGSTKLSFVSKGIFSSVIAINDLQTNQSVGEIKFNAFGSSAVIVLNNKTYTWQYDNLLQTQWSILDNEHKIVNFSASFSSGKIVSDVDDEMLFLCGLYVQNYMIQVLIFSFSMFFIFFLI
jgi:hypothetical protein